MSGEAGKDKEGCSGRRGGCRGRADEAEGVEAK